MNLIRNTRLSLVFFILIMSCKGQEIPIQKELETSFEECIIRTREGESKEETEHYLNNDAKFILQSRKEFLSNIKLSKNTEMNMVEIFDKQMPTIYSAIIKINSRLYFFKKNISLVSEFKEIDFDTLKKEYSTMACILIEMDKPKPNKLTKSPAEASYHYSVFITKINKDNNIFTYIPNDICIIEDANSLIHESIHKKKQ
ncbi:hypothetical protein [Pontimicrobium sp. MEBiC01747]